MMHCTCHTCNGTLTLPMIKHVTLFFGTELFLRTAKSPLLYSGVSWVHFHCNQALGLCRSSRARWREMIHTRVGPFVGTRNRRGGGHKPASPSGWLVRGDVRSIRSALKYEVANTRWKRVLPNPVIGNTVLHWARLFCAEWLWSFTGKTSRHAKITSVVVELIRVDTPSDRVTAHERIFRKTPREWPEPLVK